MSDQSSATKTPDLSNLPRGVISMKGLPLNRSTRLPSIRTPRDLTLGAQPKRVFTPNIPVRREKKVSVPSVEQTSLENVKTVDKKTPTFKERSKQFSRNIIQTEGSLFGEGLSASPSLKDKQREPIPKFASSRSAVKKERIDVSEINDGINELLRDDFIDDGDDDENDDVKPVFFPCQENTEVEVKKLPIKKKCFDNDHFAKEMGFDVKKIASFIKKEKGFEEKVIPDVDDTESQNEILKLFKQESPQLLLLQFPKVFSVPQPEDQQRESPNSAHEQSNIKIKNKASLSALPEGCIGKLQILKSGQARLVVGSNHYNVKSSKTLKSKQEAVSIRADSEDKSMILLGDIEHKLIVEPNVCKLIKNLR